MWQCMKVSKLFSCIMSHKNVYSGLWRQHTEESLPHDKLDQVCSVGRKPKGTAKVTSFLLLFFNHACTVVCMWVCVCVRPYMYVCMCVCVHLCMHAFCVCMCVRVHMRIHVLSLIVIVMSLSFLCLLHFWSDCLFVDFDLLIFCLFVQGKFSCFSTVLFYMYT